MSLGGPLAYHAACHRPDLAALACYCLYDYRYARFLADVSRFGVLTPLAHRVTGVAAQLLPRLRLPAELIVSYHYVAEDPQFVAVLRRNPLAGTKISLRAVDSMFRAVDDKRGYGYRYCGGGALLEVSSGGGCPARSRYLVLSLIGVIGGGRG
jgi:hypothetical protein